MGALAQQLPGSSVGQMGMSSGFFVPPQAIAQGPHDTTAPGNLAATHQSGMVPPPPPPPPPPPTPQPAPQGQSGAMAATTVAFPLPPMATQPSPSVVPFPVQQGGDQGAQASGFPSAATGLSTAPTVLSGGQSAAQGQQAPTFLPPTTTPGQFLSHSAR